MNDHVNIWQLLKSYPTSAGSSETIAVAQLGKFKMDAGL